MDEATVRNRYPALPSSKGRPRVYARFIEAAIRAAGGCDSEPPRYRARIDAEHFRGVEVVTVCPLDSHYGLSDDGPMFGVDIPAVVMKRQVWSVPGERDTLIWVGQCRVCRAILYAIR